MDSVYVCSNCLYESPFYLAECPQCGRGSFSEKRHDNALASASMTGETQTCFKCDYETSAAVKQCPRCGQRLHSADQVRVFGWILAVLGTFLIVVMTVISVAVANLILQSDTPGSTSRFNGGTKEIVFIFGIFGLVSSFGLTSLVAGIWQIRYGRRNKKLVWVMLVLALVFLFAGSIVRAID